MDVAVASTSTASWRVLMIEYLTSPKDSTVFVQGKWNILPFYNRKSECQLLKTLHSGQPHGHMCCDCVLSFDLYILPSHM